MTDPQPALAAHHASLVEALDLVQPPLGTAVPCTRLRKKRSRNHRPRNTGRTHRLSMRVRPLRQLRCSGSAGRGARAPCRRARVAPPTRRARCPDRRHGSPSRQLFASVGLYGTSSPSPTSWSLQGPGGPALGGAGGFIAARERRRGRAQQGRHESDYRHGTQRRPLRRSRRSSCRIPRVQDVRALLPASDDDRHECDSACSLPSPPADRARDFPPRTRTRFGTVLPPSTSSTRCKRPRQARSLSSQRRDRALAGERGRQDAGEHRRALRAEKLCAAVHPAARCLGPSASHWRRHTRVRDRRDAACHSAHRGCDHIWLPERWRRLPLRARPSSASSVASFG